MYQDVTVVIPFSGGPEDRLRGFFAVRDNCTRELPGARIVTAALADCYPTSYTPSVYFQRDTLTGPLQMLNLLAFTAATPILLFNNADCWLTGEQLRGAVEQVRRGADLVYPYDGRFIDCAEPGQWEGAAVLHPHSIAGAQMVKRESFFTLGGWDEHFTGAGPDDLELYRRFERYAGWIARMPGPLWHYRHANVSYAERWKSDQAWRDYHAYLERVTALPDDEALARIRGMAWATI